MGSHRLAYIRTHEGLDGCVCFLACEERGRKGARWKSCGSFWGRAQVSGCTLDRVLGFWGKAKGRAEAQGHAFELQQDDCELQPARSAVWARFRERGRSGSPSLGTSALEGTGSSGAFLQVLGHCDQTLSPADPLQRGELKAKEAAVVLAHMDAVTERHRKLKV